MRYNNFYLIPFCLIFNYLQAQEGIIINNTCNSTIYFFIDREDATLDKGEVKPNEMYFITSPQTALSVVFFYNKTIFESLVSKLYALSLHAPGTAEIKTFSKNELTKTRYIVIYLDETNNFRAEASTPLHLLSSPFSAFLSKDITTIIDVFTMDQKLFKEALLKLQNEVPTLELSRKKNLNHEKLTLEWKNLLLKTRIELGKETLYSIMGDKEKQLPIDKLSYRELIIGLMWSLFEMHPKRTNIDRSTILVVGKNAEKINQFLLNYVALINPDKSFAFHPKTPHAYRYPMSFGTFYGIDINMPVLPDNARHISFSFDPSHKQLTIQLLQEGIGIKKTSSTVIANFSAIAAAVNAKLSKEKTPEPSFIKILPPIKIEDSDIQRLFYSTHPTQHAAPTIPTSNPPSASFATTDKKESKKTSPSAAPTTPVSNLPSTSSAATGGKRPFSSTDLQEQLKNLKLRTKQQSLTSSTQQELEHIRTQLKILKKQKSTDHKKQEEIEKLKHRGRDLEIKLFTDKKKLTERDIFYLSLLQRNRVQEWQTDVDNDEDKEENNDFE